MNKLSFHSLGSESTETVKLLVIILPLMIIFSFVAFGVFDLLRSISSTGQIFVISVCTLIPLICIIVLWRKVKESVGDMTLGKRIKYFIYYCIFGTAFTLLGFKLEFFLYIGIIVSIVGFVFYCLIISRCIKAGDEHVKKFGKLLLWSLVSLIILVVLFTKLELLWKQLKEVRWIITLIVRLEIPILLFYLFSPYYYFYKICKTLNANKEYKNANKEELWGKQTFTKDPWWWIIPLCVLGAILVMSQIG